MNRYDAYQNLANHPWFNRFFRKLRGPGHTRAKEFILENQECDHGEFILRVNRMFMDVNPKPAQWELILDLLTAASVASDMNKKRIEQNNATLK